MTTMLATSSWCRWIVFGYGVLANLKQTLLYYIQEQTNRQHKNKSKR